LDPKQIKLPPPFVPSEKLLKAVEEFYNTKDKKINEYVLIDLNNFCLNF
jgi:hypothetical protein